jgi:hypothetical protein
MIEQYDCKCQYSSNKQMSGIIKINKFQGGEDQDDGGRHHGEVAGPVQHARDHGEGRGENSLRHCRISGKLKNVKHDIQVGIVIVSFQVS